jgi:hypothetical protein
MMYKQEWKHEDKNGQTVAHQARLTTALLALTNLAAMQSTAPQLHCF